MAGEEGRVHGVEMKSNTVHEGRTATLKDKNWQAFRVLI